MKKLFLNITEIKNKETKDRLGKEYQKKFYEPVECEKRGE